MNRSGRLGMTAAVLLWALMITFSVGVAAADGIYAVSDFDADGHGWSAGEGLSHGITSYAADGYDARLCLEVLGQKRGSGYLASVSKSFEEPLDLSEYRSLSYDIFIPKNEKLNGEGLQTELLVYCQNEEKPAEYRFAVEADKWNTVEADISALSGRGKITGIEIGFVVETKLITEVSYSFYLDSVTAGGRIDRGMLERFMFDTFTLEGASSKMPLDKSSITLVKTSDAPAVLKPEAVIPENVSGADTLRLKIMSKDAPMQLAINVTAADIDGRTVEKSSVLTLAKDSQAQYYYVNVGDFSKVISFELVFEGGVGEIVICSVSAVQAYSEERYTLCGNVTEFMLTDRQGGVKLRGVLNNDVLADTSGKLALYEWNQNSLPGARQLSRSTPVSSCKVSKTFDLSFSLGDSIIRRLGSTYVVVLMRDDGSCQYVSAPIRITNPELMAKTSFSHGTDEKGFASDDISIVGDSDTGITVLELDVKKAFSDSGKGVSYSYGSASYQLDAHYIGALDKKIAALSGAGVDVLVRIFDSGSNGSLVASDAEAVGVLSYYCSEKWCATGAVRGVILGKGENIIPSGSVFDEAAQATARMLWTAYVNAVSFNSGARVYLSVTDLVETELATGCNEVALMEYLPAMVKETSVGGRFPWNICIEPQQREKSVASVADVNGTHTLSAILKELDCDEKRVIFTDSRYTDGITFTELEQQFILGYYGAFFNDAVDAYIADTTGFSETAHSLAETVRYIDTDKASVKVENAFLSAGADAVENAVEGFSKSKLPSRTVLLGELFTEEPKGIKGRFRYFSFDSLSSASTVSASYFAENPAIVNDGGSTLGVRLSPTLYGEDCGAAWMGIAHRFEYTENMSFTKTLALNLKVSDPKLTGVESVPVKLVLVGANGRFEASAAVAPNKWVTLYADISDFCDIRSVGLLQVLVGNSELDSATLLVRGIEGLSDRQSDEALADTIAQARERKLVPVVDDKLTTYTLAVGGVLLVLITVMVFRVLRRRRRYDEDEQT